MSDRSTPTGQMKFLVAIGAVLVILVVASFLLFRAAIGPAPAPVRGPSAAAGAPATNVDAAADAASGSSRRRERALGTGDFKSDDEAAEYLREEFGRTIENKHTQIKAIEKLINYLMQRYPNDWQSRLQALLAKAFPGLADQLFAMYQNMTSYQEWLKANQEELAKMSYAERREALHDARFRYFGADAEEIFAEMFRQEQIFDAMEAIRGSHDTTVDQKLDTYMDAIDNAYGDAAPQFIERRQTELMTRFLSIDTVQDDLHAMTPEQRQTELASIREAMGLDADAQARWRDLDTERDAAWDRGETYMEERGKIVESSSGDEQARRLAELRRNTFGEEEADIIRTEEESGFFRFDHRRTFGKE